jgi:hypothetical protein
MFGAEIKPEALVELSFRFMRPPPPAFRALMAKREPQIILKTDERKIHLELGMEGQFAAKSSSCDENRVFLEGDRLEVSVKNGRWVLCYVPARPTAPKPVLHCFPDDE